ncbi:hypothetical protein HYV57_02950 [Candidatus Peregrinibacteria bacterium]|nr:hypothetical protein [Candidatus Peregrinibacteria bacterium]
MESSFSKIRPFSSHENPFVSAEERERWQYVFYGEWFFDLEIDDEYRERVGLLENFVQEEKIVSEPMGVILDVTRNETEFIVAVKTKQDSQVAMEKIIEIKKKLEEKHGCLLRDGYMAENIDSFFENDFSSVMSQCPEAYLVEARGRRVILQSQKIIRWRLERALARQQRVERILEDSPGGTSQIHEQGESDTSSSPFIAFYRQQVARQICALQKALQLIEITMQKTDEPLKFGGMLTDTQNISRFPIPEIVPLSSIMSSASLRDTSSDHQEVNPSLCSTVGDILEHPLIQAAVRKAVPQSRETHEITLIYLLSTEEGTRILLRHLKEIVDRIQSIQREKSVCDDEQWEDQKSRALKGLDALRRYVRTYPREKFSTELKAQRLRDLKCPETLVDDASMEIPGSKEQNSSCLPFGIQEFRSPSGETFYFQKDSTGTFLPAIYKNKKIKKIQYCSISFSEITEKNRGYAIITEDDHGYFVDESTGVMQEFAQAYCSAVTGDFFYQTEKDGSWYHDGCIVEPVLTREKSRADSNETVDLVIISLKGKKEIIIPEGMSKGVWNIGNLICYTPHTASSAFPNCIFDVNLDPVMIDEEIGCQISEIFTFGERTWVRLESAGMLSRAAIIDAETAKCTRVVDSNFGLPSTSRIPSFLQISSEAECVKQDPRTPQMKRQSFTITCPIMPVPSFFGRPALINLSSYNQEEGTFQIVRIQGIQGEHIENLEEAFYWGLEAAFDPNKTSSFLKQTMPNEILGFRKAKIKNDVLMVDMDSFDPENSTLKMITVEDMPGFITSIEPVVKIRSFGEKIRKFRVVLSQKNATTGKRDIVTIVFSVENYDPETCMIRGSKDLVIQRRGWGFFAKKRALSYLIH